MSIKGGLMPNATLGKSRHLSRTAAAIAFAALLAGTASGEDARDAAGQKGEFDLRRQVEDGGVSPFAFDIECDLFQEFAGDGGDVRGTFKVQPYAGVAWSPSDGFSLDASVFVDSSSNNRMKPNELDFSLSATKTVGDLAFSAGPTLIAFPGTRDGTTWELCGSVTWLSPAGTFSVDAARDMRTDKGSYFDVVYYRDFELKGGPLRKLLGETASLSLSTGGDCRYWRSAAGWTYAAVGVCGSGWDAGRRVTITPFMNATYGFGKEYESSVAAGLTLSTSF